MAVLGLLIAAIASAADQPAAVPALPAQPAPSQPVPSQPAASQPAASHPAASSVAADQLAGHTTAADQAPFRFRRVFVPQDQIVNWPRHGERYLPIDAAEFDRVAAEQTTANATTDRAPSAVAPPSVSSAGKQPPTVEIVRAVYEARLSGDDLTDGSATLEIRHEGEGLALLPLDPCRLPIQSPQWESPRAGEPAAKLNSPAVPNSGETAAAPTAVAPTAVLGVGADGKLALEVERSGTLRFDWTLVGRRETGAAIAFDLKLPPSPANEIRLTAPAELLPTVERGFVTPIADSGDAPATAAVSANAANIAKSPAMQRWKIEFGGRSHVVLRLARRDFLQEVRPLTLMRQSLVYEFSPRGLQLSADLKLDVLGEPLGQIALLVDRPLTLVTARYGSAQLPWYETTAGGKPAAGTAQHRIVLELPEPLRGTGRLVRLGFVAPAMSRGRLPNVRPDSEGLFWQEGSASLLVPTPLELDELTLGGARQTKAEPLPAPQSGDAISLQYFKPDADVNVALARRADRPHVESGTLVEVRGNTMSGRCYANVSVQNGECFDLAADVAPGWIVDAVETVPADCLADWNLKPSANAGSRLEIVLAKPIRSDRPVRIVVSGRWRRAPLGERLRSEDLAMVAMRDATTSRRLAAVRAASPFRLQTSGADGLHRLDPVRLSATDIALLGGAIDDGTFVFVDDSAAVDLTVKLVNETPQFTGAVHVDAQLADTSLVEAYRIRCRPETGELDRLLVHFSRRRDEPIRWKLAGENDASPSNAPFAASPDLQNQISAQRLSAAEQAALGLTAGGEVWELKFRQPSDKPIEIQAIRTSTFAADTPLSLASLERAKEQQGSIAIWSSAKHLPIVANRHLQPVPIDRPEPALLWQDASDPLRRGAEPPLGAIELAAFEYSPPDEIVAAAVEPTASLTVSPGGERPAAWAWSCRLDSYYSPDGSSVHFASWRIENSGRGFAEIQLPAGAVLHSAWLDGTPTTAVAASLAATDDVRSTEAAAKSADPKQTTGSVVRLQLPFGRRFVRIALEWGSVDAPLSLISARTSQLAQIDMPVLARQWHVWLPPRFQLSDRDLAGGSSLAPTTWSQRLFGPFGRNDGQSVFNPLDDQQWTGVARRFADRDAAWTGATQLAERIDRRATAAAADTAVRRAKARSSQKLLSSVRAGAPGRDASPTVPPPASPANPSPATAGQSDVSNVTWGELLSAAAATAPATAPGASNGSHPSTGASPSLWIDARALAGVALHARSAVPLSSADVETASPLARADLVLIADPRAIVLTTRSAAAVWNGPDSLVEGVVQRAPSGPFDEQLQQSLSGAAERFEPVKLWAFAGPTSPWGAAAGEMPPIDHAGWAVYDLTLFDQPLEIGIVDRDLMLGIGCGVFLLTLLLVFVTRGVSWKRRGIALGGATFIALALPQSCAPLGTGLWLGLVGGWAFRTLVERTSGTFSRRRFAGPGNGALAASDGSASQPGDTTLRHPGPAGPIFGLLLALVFLTWNNAPAAQDADATNRGAPAAGDIADVLIPCDAHQRFVGSVYLVTERLYRQIMLYESRSHKDSRQSWLVTSADYHGGLARTENTAVLDTTDWSVNYDLEVLALPAHVWIPLGDSTTNLLPDGVRLDGQAIPFQVEGKEEGPADKAQGSEESSRRMAATRGVAFDVAAAGHHQISFAFRPTARKQGDAATIDFAILPLATSRLEFSAPNGVAAELQGACGVPSNSHVDRAAAGVLTDMLGPIDHLTVRGSSDAAGGEAKPAVFDADELYWLKVRPGSVTLEARFNIRVAEGRLAQVRLLEDPRLRRLPLEADSPISEVRTEEGDLHTMYVGLTQPVVDRTSFKLSFLLTDASGIGNLRLPRLDLVGARSVERRLAVSVDAPLEFDAASAAPAAVASPAAELFAPAKFLAAWGAADAKPQLAYTLPLGDTNWNLPIHSRRPQVESRESAVIAVSHGRLQESWLADLSVTGGSVFQIQIPAPAEWEVEQAVLRQEGSPDQAVRWARNPTGGLTLFLPGPAPESSQLLLRGSTPFAVALPAARAAGVVIALPDLRVAGPQPVRIVSRSVLLLRGGDVQLALTDPAGMKAASRAELRAAVDRAVGDGLLSRTALDELRPTACLTSRQPSSNRPSIRVSANAPSVDGKELTTIRRIDDGWQAAVDLDLNVTGGVLDELRLDLPPQWSGAAEITPATPSRTVEVAGEDRRQLLLRPKEPWSGAVRLHLAAAVSTPAGQRLRVPDVRPHGIAPLHRYVLLPTRAVDQNLRWETSGLNVEPLPKRFKAGQSPVDLYRTWEVVDEHFEATLKSVEKTIGPSRVRLADIAVTCSDGGHCYGAATFDIEPAGAANCMLRLAPNEELIHVRADGVAAAPRPIGEKHWSIGLGDGKLPQQIEVVFTADLSGERETEGGLPLFAPELVDWPAEQTLWSVTAAGDGTALAEENAANVGPDAAGRASGRTITVSGAEPATGVAQSLVRLETVSQLLDSTGSGAEAEPDEQIVNWFGPWSERLLLARSEIERVRVGEGTAAVGRATEDRVRAIDAAQRKLARRLGIEDALSDSAAAQPMADDVLDLWKGSVESPTHVAGFFVHGDGPSLAIELPGRRLPEPVWRIFVAILGAGLVSLLFWIGGRSGRFTSVKLPTAAAGIVGGIFWWLALEPGWLGLLIVALSGAAMLGASRLRPRGTDSSGSPEP